MLDCVIVGGGPAGLTAALDLARFGRRFALIDAGEPRAAWIPKSHNIPFFEAGISGADILKRQYQHLERYGVTPLRGDAREIAREKEGFTVSVQSEGDSERSFVARRVLLASGSRDVEPELPDLPDAIRRGLVRYCRSADGFEAGGKRIAVIGHGAHGLGEAVFIARTYSRDVTLLTLGQPMRLDAEQQAAVERHHVRVVADPVSAIELEDDRIASVSAAGRGFGSTCSIPPSGWSAGRVWRRRWGPRATRRARCSSTSTSSPPCPASTRQAVLREASTRSSSRWATPRWPRPHSQPLRTPDRRGGRRRLPDEPALSHCAHRVRTPRHVRLSSVELGHDGPQRNFASLAEQDFHFPAPQLARALIGAHFTVDGVGGVIVETEAYKAGRPRLAQLPRADAPERGDVRPARPRLRLPQLRDALVLQHRLRIARRR